MELFDWLEHNIESLLSRNPEALAFAIERSCIDKAQVVAADELEAGQRALLNLGHTFGHAIETGVGYGAWLHGEAVGAGMCMAAKLSMEHGWITQQEEARITALVGKSGLPTEPPGELSVDQMLEFMAVDKKVQDGNLRLVLMKGIGSSLVTDRFDLDRLKHTLNSY